MAMLRGLRGRAVRPFFITAGALPAGVLLLLMTGLDLLVLFGYIPYTIRSLFIGDKIRHGFLEAWTKLAMIHQLLCLMGGFLWLGATVSYARQSEDACVYCGRRDGQEGWNSPDNARRWGRIAVYGAMVAPIFYAITRYARAIGFPLGMSEEHLRRSCPRYTNFILIASSKCFQN